MSLSSPGQGHSPWLASIPSREWPIDSFLRSGNKSVPVALVPTNGGSIQMKNPKAIQVELRKASSQFQKITEVRQFGRGGILCCSSDQECVRDLLNCSEFASNPVSPFIPPHLACSKGLVRGVDASLDPSEVLDLFSVAGAVSVYRCSRIIENRKSPTESVIVTFAGTVRPTEIKAWPLIYRVEPLSPRPLQCLKCWRYGHTIKGCRSVTRCRLCGENHDSTECKSQEENCCLCNEAHPADYSNCSAKERELRILEVVERRRCSRREAVTEVQGRSQGYAGVTARHTASMDVSLSKAIAEAVEKAMEKAMERLATTLFESLTQMMTSQMAQVIGAASTQSPAYQVANVLNITQKQTLSSNSSADSPCAGPSTQVERTEPEPLTEEYEDYQDVDMEHKSLKRTRSPPHKISSKSKTQKYEKVNLSKKDFLKETILDQAVSATVLSSP